MDDPKWYVLRDLKRPNAKDPAWRMLPDLGFKVFTPMKTVIIEEKGKKIREERPVIADLLFVRSDAASLDRVIERTATLQHRYVKGAPYRTPMTVPAAEMERFIAAVSTSFKTDYYLPGELTPDMIGRDVRIVDGPLAGHTGKILRLRGRSKPKLLISLHGLLTAAVEVEKTFLEFV